MATRKPKRQVKLEQRLALLEQDKARMDWLEQKHVEVRQPLLHGSSAMFHASPEDQEGLDPLPSDLRKQIDDAMQAEFYGVDIDARACEAENDLAAMDAQQRGALKG